MDPQRIIDQRPMSSAQIAAVGITVGLNALDGFDVLAISFAAPGVAAEWGVERGALGIVLSMELIGMAAGSILLGGAADRIGRKPAILGCLVLMALGMAGAPLARDVVALSAWRFLTGIGIGGMIPALNAAAAEFANARRRRTCLSLMVIGYPLGAVIGGAVTAEILRHADWRAIFLFGAAATTTAIPLAAALLPETPAHLAERRPPDALAKINRTLARMGHPAIDALPEAAPRRERLPTAELFTPGLSRTTVLVTIGYFAHIVVFYFVAKWLPKIVVDMGHHPSEAAGVLVWLNLGGVVGGLTFGIAAQRFGLKPMTVLAMMLTTAMVVAFGRGQGDLAGLSAISAAVGFFILAGIVGLYTAFAEAFPTHARAAGTGFAIGVGRGGAVAAPIIAGFLFQAGLGLAAVSALIGAVSLLAAAAIMFVRLESGKGS